MFKISGHQGILNESTTRYRFVPTRLDKLKRWMAPSVGEIEIVIHC